jgi:signal transduction histidine kinase
MEVDLAVDALPTDLPEETQIALYRVVQEALTNVARHARATRASVLATAHAGRLRLVIEDDGRGFDPATPTGRLGLVGIRERVELLGGQLRIESAPGAGTAVIVDLEVPNE